MYKPINSRNAFLSQLRRNYFVILFDVETIWMLMLFWLRLNSFLPFHLLFGFLAHFDFSSVIRFWHRRSIFALNRAGLDKIWQFCCCLMLFSTRTSFLSLRIYIAERTVVFLSIMNKECSEGRREDERGCSQVFVHSLILLKEAHFVGSSQSHNINLSSAAYLSRALCCGTEDTEPLKYSTKLTAKWLE